MKAVSSREIVFPPQFHSSLTVRSKLLKKLLTRNSMKLLHPQTRMGARPMSSLATLTS